eukprot:251023-Prorocentrum_minimum.AAC.2
MAAGGADNLTSTIPHFLRRTRCSFAIGAFSRCRPGVPPLLGPSLGARCSSAIGSRRGLGQEGSNQKRPSGETFGEIITRSKDLRRPAQSRYVTARPYTINGSDGTSVRCFPAPCKP